MFEGEQWGAIHRLWDELPDFPAADLDGACRHLMQIICNLIGADNATWVGVARMKQGALARKDILQGWRAAASVSRRLYSRDESRFVKRLIKEQDSDPGMASIAIARAAGQFRVHRMRDGFVDFAKFRRTRHYQLAYRAFGIDDRMWVGFPVHKDTESFFLFDKLRTRRRFSEDDAALAGEALRGIKWFHRQLLLGHGLAIAEKPLTSMQRRVLGLLLTEKSEKEISVALGHSFDTTHTHVMEIYHRLGVNGRAGLMALWLGK